MSSLFQHYFSYMYNLDKFQKWSHITSVELDKYLLAIMQSTVTKPMGHKDENTMASNSQTNGINSFE